ncbi:hypothetical protein QJQ45_016103, partial [Haematococcus lacustris]
MRVIKADVELGRSCQASWSAQFQLAGGGLMGGEFTLSPNMVLGTKAMKVKWLEREQPEFAMSFQINDGHPMMVTRYRSMMVTPALQLHRRMAMRLLRTISGSRAMHAMFFPADGVAPMWSETACACVRHMGSKPQQCMCHGASTLSSIPMFGRVTLASDKEEDVQCLKLLHARAPHIASSYMTLTVHLLKEYARCLCWKGKSLTQNKPLLRADILEHLRWEVEMDEDQLAEVGVDEADD